MVEAFHSIVMQAMKLALDKANVFVLSCHNEATSIDNQSCISIHTFYLWSYEFKPIYVYFDNVL
jgi:hypothetical protein